MQVIDSTEAFQREYPQCVATIGKYDGMHLGHQRILRHVMDEAHARGLPSVVILSEPQPQEFFAADQAPARLSHFWDKVDFLRDFGIDVVFRLNFDQSMSGYSAEAFIEDYLVKGLGVQCLVVGHDFRFGQGRRGDLDMLREYGTREGFSVQVEDAVYLDGERISSTLVRQYLEQGDLDRVRRLLGRAYSIAGEVVRGRQLGRQLGTPTANVQIVTRTLPMTGVFAVKVLFRKREFNGVANLGYKPTVEENPSPSLEVYIFDFDADVYGAWLKVSFEHKLREEVKFAGLDELKQQIARDVKDARDYFSSAQTGEVADK